MKPSAYASYKPSGVKWLGDIPSHWQPKRMRFLLTQKLQYGANEAAELDDPELPRYVRITDIDEQGTLREETFRSLPVEIAKPYLLKDGDILFARSGATSGKTFLYRNSWGTCAYAGYLIRARLNQGKMLPSFLRYFTASANYWQWLSSSTIQATIQNVSAEKYADLWLTYPPIAEQQTIADFLDAQTARIDTLLANKQQFIAKLKEKRSALIARTVTRGLPPAAAQAAGLVPHPAMKDAGVEWLDDVPAHWGVTRLGFLCDKIGSGKTPHGGADVYADEGIMFLRSQNIYDEGLMLDDVVYITEEIDNDMQGTRVKPRDILLNVTGASLGRTCIVPTEFVNANVNQHVCIIRLEDLSLSSFIAWVIKAPFIKAQIEAIQSGAAREGLNFGQISKLALALPPPDEQQVIAAYLDREAARIDQLTAKVEAAIARLTEYRQALITAAVTGKIDVRAQTVG